MADFLFSSESVAAGHPDKVCDAVSDAILDALLAETARCGLPAAYVRCACETLVKTGLVVVAGEVRVAREVRVDVERVVRDTIAAIGYNRAGDGFDAVNSGVINVLGAQSDDIAQGVDGEKGTGAGDQGLMFGFACDETPALMPMPIQIAHALMRRHAEVREGELAWLGPDAKSQVAVRYADGKPAAVAQVVLSSQHDDDRKNEAIRAAIIEWIIRPVLEEYGMAMPAAANVLVNPSGRFVKGGPAADCGLTGRKIIVDTYGGAAPHGGGAFSGKDPTKVDRSAAYMMRYVAKNIVAAGLARRCLVQAAYAIGVAEPVSIMVDTQGTGELSDAALEARVCEVFDLTPDGIVAALDLWRPIYGATAAYGHFGRDGFRWEDTDKAAELAR